MKPAVVPSTLQLGSSSICQGCFLAQKLRLGKLLGWTYMSLCLPNKGLCLSVVSRWELKREGLVQPPPRSKYFPCSNPPGPCPHPPSHLIAARSLAFSSKGGFLLLSLWGPQVWYGPGFQMNCDPPPPTWFMMIGVLVNFSSFGAGYGGSQDKSSTCVKSASADRREKTFCDF